MLLALPILRGLGLARDITASEVITRLVVSRSRAYELKKELIEVLSAYPRPRGRPKKVRSEPPVEPMFATAAAVRDYLARRPGSEEVGARRRGYTDRFRFFVVGLLSGDGPGAPLSLEQAATAVGVPLSTLRDWRLRQLPPLSAVDEDLSDEPDDIERKTSVTGGVFEKVVALRAKWRGSFAGFVRSLVEHRLYLSGYKVRQILQLAGIRTPRPRGRKATDAEAVRGSFETFFAGAQFIADGKTVDITIGQDTYRFCWELCVDGATGAHVGFSVRDHEDSRGLLDALDHAEKTTGRSPEALLRDNLPANHSEEVEETLAQRDIISMPSTVYRPENKAPVEGEFGLFSQRMPPVVLPAGTKREQARSVLFWLLYAYACGRNQVPRRKLGGRSAAEAFEDDEPSAQEREDARARLTEIRDRILDAREAERKRLDPVCRTVLEEAFSDLDLDDPEGTFIPAISRHGLDAALEAVAIFSAKREADTLPDGVDARYLLGIARNVAHRNEDEQVYAELVRLREQAKDLFLAPLRAVSERLRSELPPTEYLDACLERALAERFIVDRHFWRRETLDAFSALPDELRRRRGPVLTRMIATQYGLACRERDQFISELARATVSICGGR